MKKVLISLFIIMLLLSGCGKKNSESSLKEFSKIINNSDSYMLEGNLKLLSNNEEYLYDVKVYFKKGDYYKVSLLNKTTDTEQIILKNDEGVYVVTPSINKSFKFQSEWPNNSSQSYILETLLSDIEADDERIYNALEEGYEFIVDVNYPNNKSLVNQKITFNKNNLPCKVEVYNEEEIGVITFVITKIDMNARIDSNIFKLENNIKDNVDTQTFESIDTVMYPTYLPLNTVFASQETITGVNSERVILTFKGDKSFVMVEESSTAPKKMEVVSVYGDLAMIEDTIGVLTDSSVMWNKGNREFYVSSSNLSTEELLTVASSTRKVALTK